MTDETNLLAINKTKYDTRLSRDIRCVPISALPRLYSDPSTINNYSDDPKLPESIFPKIPISKISTTDPLSRNVCGNIETYDTSWTSVSSITNLPQRVTVGNSFSGDFSINLSSVRYINGNGYTINLGAGTLNNPDNLVCDNVRFYGENGGYDFSSIGTGRTYYYIQNSTLRKIMLVPNPGINIIRLNASAGYITLCGLLEGCVYTISLNINTGSYGLGISNLTANNKNRTGNYFVIPASYVPGTITLTAMANNVVMINSMVPRGNTKLTTTTQ